MPECQLHDYHADSMGQSYIEIRTEQKYTSQTPKTAHSHKHKETLY